MEWNWGFHWEEWCRIGEGNVIHFGAYWLALARG